MTLKNIIVLLIFLGIFFVGAILAINVYNQNKFEKKIEVKKETQVDYKNIEYVIDGQKIHLINGISEIEVVPGSASKIVTRYFGNEVEKDLDGDGVKDVAFLLTQETGGSGVFFYVVGAIKTKDGYVGSKGFFLGDRIAPQTTESGKGNQIIVNYADRLPGEPFTTRPSMGKSAYLSFDKNKMEFSEVLNPVVR